MDGIANADFGAKICHYFILAPSQQLPPRGHVLNSSTIVLSWDPPDSPNSNWLTYNLYRNGSEIYTVKDHYPYSEYLSILHMYILHLKYILLLFIICALLTRFAYYPDVLQYTG